MKITRLYMFVSIVFATLLCKTECQLFNLNPQSVTVTEGSNVTFTCGSEYLGDCGRFSISWKRRKDQDSAVEQISACSSVTENFERRIWVVVEGDSDRYHLHIHNVQQDDAGAYWCYMNNAGIRNSEEALLTVNPLLTEHKPSCDFEPEQPRVGSTISFKCTLSERDAPSLLTWFESKSSGPTKIEDITEVNPGETYAVERELTESDNMVEFTCVAGPHPDGPSCSITPLQIPPTVSISPSHLTIHEHENATFSCDFKSTPQQIADEYNWRVSRVDKHVVKINTDTLQSLYGRFELGQNGQTLQIINVIPEEFNNSQIRCIVFQDSAPIPSVNDSLLFVLPLFPAGSDRSSSESSDKPHLFPTIDSYPTPCDVPVVISDAEKYWQWSRTAVIIGGAVEVLVFMVATAVLIGCYIVKNKRKREGPRPQPSDGRVIPSPARHQGSSVAMADLTNSLTYTELKREDGELSEPSPYQNLRSDAQGGHEIIYSNVP